MVREQSNFLEVNTDQAAQIRSFGLPSDVVPVDSTVLGTQFTGGAPEVQSYLDCCFSNISKPLYEAAVDAGVTDLIYGQRDDEAHTSPAKDGDKVGALTRLHPIADWSTKRVLQYLHDQMGTLPPHFSIEHSSLDCYDCTAYARHSKDRIVWMRAAHPPLYAQYLSNQSKLSGILKSAMEPYYGR